MLKSFVFGSVVILLSLLSTACFRAEVSEVAIHIPAMENQRDARIVTNAALDEVVGCLSPQMHAYEFDLENHTVLYHEGQHLTAPAYQSQLIQSLEAVGFDASVQRAGFNPLPVRKFPDGSIINNWPTRFTALISIPELDTVTEANIVVDALALVRNGGNDPRVTPDLANRKLDVIYDNVALSWKNIEEAIACTGYAANGIPPKTASSGWNLFTFAPQ